MPLSNFPKSVQEAKVELEMGVWSSKDRHINHQTSVLQHHSLFWDSGHGHIVECESRSSGFRSRCQSAGMLHLLCAIFAEHMHFSNCLSSVSTLFITTSLSAATTCCCNAGRIGHTQGHVFQCPAPWINSHHPLSSSGFITGRCIERSGLPQRSLP